MKNLNTEQGHRVSPLLALQWPVCNQEPREMKMIKRYGNLAARTALVFISVGLSGFAAAADNCSGTWNNVVASTTNPEIAKDHKMTTWLYTAISRSEDAPFMTNSGECSGYSITAPNGKNQSAGGCIRKATDGTTYTETWEMAPGADKGTWKYVGVTGPNAGKAMSGWWQFVAFEGKAAFGTWGGTCK